MGYKSIKYSQLKLEISNEKILDQRYHFTGQ